MSSSRDADDLVVLARRGTLSEAETRRLRDALATSEETRWLHEAGIGFDAEGLIVAGDDARIARIVRNVRGVRLPTRGPRWLRVARGTAAILFAAGVAAAGVELTIGLQSFGDDEPAAVEAPSVPTPGAIPRRAPQAPPRATAAHEELPDPESIDPPHESVARPTAAFPASPKPAAPRPIEPIEAAPPPENVSGPAASQATLPAPIARFDDAHAAAPSAPVAQSTAEGVFAAANRARMRGDAPQAIALYEQLGADFPRSSEASASRVTLGVLYLQQEQPERALAAFRRSHTAEALWGQAEALRQLGRTSEERAVLENLLRLHPRSAYAGAAQKRLANLD